MAERSGPPPPPHAPDPQTISRASSRGERSGAVAPRSGVGTISRASSRGERSGAVAPRSGVGTHGRAQRTAAATTRPGSENVPLNRADLTFVSFQ